MDEPLPSTRETYDAIGARFLENARDRSAFTPWFDRFERDLPAGAVVVDVGAGPGLDTAELRRRGLAAISLDFSRGMLRAGAAGSPGPRVQGDARRLPIASAVAAGVWANASLLHLSQEEAGLALREIRRVLRPGGVLFATLKQGEGSEWESDRYGKPRFFQYWTEERLDAALDAAGFGILEARADAAPRNVWLVRLASARSG